ncbi:MAG: benzoate/H(+) symporter BenE family transporter [Candidatus Binatia bacterium]
MSSIALSVYYRQPIPINWIIPGLIYPGTLAHEFTFSQLVGANLMAGFIIVGLGLLGIGAGITASVLAERNELLAHWSEKEAAGN